MTNDMVNHPPHYNDHPSGIEAIEFCELLPGTLASAFKYVWRAGLKWDDVEDLEKSKWYMERTWTHFSNLDWLVISLYMPSPSVVAVIRRDMARVLKHENKSTKGKALSAIVACYTTPETGNKIRYCENAIRQIEEMIGHAVGNKAASEETSSSEGDDPYPHPEAQT